MTENKSANNKIRLEVQQAHKSDTILQTKEIQLEVTKLLRAVHRQI